MSLVTMRAFNETTGEPSWWMQIILSLAMIMVIVVLLWSVATFGFVETVAVGLAGPFILGCVVSAILGI